jgi:hypothetical protein
MADGSLLEPGKVEQERRQLETIFKLQSAYLDRMETLFEPNGYSSGAFEDALKAIQQHRGQLRIISALNTHAHGKDGRNRMAWRPGRQDREAVRRGNPAGLRSLAGELLAYASPIHGLAPAALKLLDAANGGHDRRIGDSIRHFYENGLVLPEAETATAMLNAIRHMALHRSEIDAQSFAAAYLPIDVQQDDGRNLAACLQAICIERNGGVDPFSNHQHFYLIAAEAARSGHAEAGLNAFLATLARTGHSELDAFVQKQPN